jgi:hypothetical protein
MVSAGTRPSRPSASADIGFTDKIWVIIQRGWAHEPADRPALVEFLEVIESEITHRRKLAMDGRQGPLDAQKRMLNTEEKVSDTVATERLLPASKSATTSAAAPTFESPPVSAPLSIPGASSSMPLPARSPGTMSPHADEELASALSTYLARLDRQYREGIAAPYDSDERVQEVIDGLDKVCGHCRGTYGDQLMLELFEGIKRHARKRLSLRLGRAAAPEMVPEVRTPAVLVYNSEVHRARDAGAPAIFV